MARGDHVFVYTWGYSHHGIDCGDGTVIHFDGGPWRESLRACANVESAAIRRVNWEEFCRDRSVHVRIHDTSYFPDEVVCRAESRLGEIGYTLLDNNCEHFAVWCKTGTKHSTQAEAAWHALRGAAEQLPVSLTFLRAARLLSGRYRLAAVGAALGVTAGKAAGRYLQRRIEHIQKKQS